MDTLRVLFEEGGAADILQLAPSTPLKNDSQPPHAVARARRRPVGLPTWLSYCLPKSSYCVIFYTKGAEHAYPGGTVSLALDGGP